MRVSDSALDEQFRLARNETRNVLLGEAVNVRPTAFEATYSLLELSDSDSHRFQRQRYRNQCVVFTSYTNQAKFLPFPPIPPWYASSVISRILVGLLYSTRELQPWSGCIYAIYVQTHGRQHYMQPLGASMQCGKFKWEGRLKVIESRMSIPIVSFRSDFSPVRTCNVRTQSDDLITAKYGIVIADIRADDFEENELASYMRANTCTTSPPVAPSLATPGIHSDCKIWRQKINVPKSENSENFTQWYRCGKRCDRPTSEWQYFRRYVAERWSDGFCRRILHARWRENTTTTRDNPWTISAYRTIRRNSVDRWAPYDTTYRWR